MFYFSMIWIIGMVIPVVFAVVYLVNNKKLKSHKVTTNILFGLFGVILCGLPFCFENINLETKMVVTVVCCAEGLTLIALILLSFRPNYASEVSRLMKQEEQKKVYEKYEASTQPPLPQGLNQTQGQTLSATQPVEQTQSREISEQTSVQAPQQSQVQATGSPQAPNLPRMPQELKDRLQQQNNDNKNE